MDSFEHVRPLNFKPKTPGEIYSKASSQDTITDNRKGNIFFLNKKDSKFKFTIKKCSQCFFKKHDYYFSFSTSTDALTLPFR